MLLPAIAVFSGFLIDKLKDLRWVLIGLFVFTTFFAFTSRDAVTIDDARIGSSQKNVTEVAGWLSKNTKDRKGYILISAASHDAIIFSSGLPMKRFIHEGTGLYWESAIAAPEKWARWIVMRTYDDNDSTWKNVSRTKGFQDYRLVETYPFATIYELKDEYLNTLNTTPVFGKQK
jgi:glutamine cyclotransferase